MVTEPEPLLERTLAAVRTKAMPNGHDAGTGQDVPWRAPEPLAPPPEPAVPFPMKIMGPWQSWSAEQAQVASAPVDFVALPLLTVAGAAIANTRWGSPQRGWAEPPVLCTALVGLPSSGKSPALELVTGPLTTAERELGRGAAEARRKWETAAATAEAVADRWAKEVKAAAKDGTPAPLKPADATAPPEPYPARLSTNNATVEVLANILTHEPKGIAFVADELAALFGNLDKYGGNGGDRPFFLSAYGGGSYVVDRVKFAGGPRRVEHLSIAVVGGIQPDRLRTMLLSGDNDGLAARFVFVRPDPVPLLKNTPHPSPERLTDAILALRRLDMAKDAATGDDYPARVPFTTAGRDAHFDFRQRVREAEQHACVMFCGWLGKSPGRVARVACILEFLWWAWDPHACAAPVEISTDAVRAAIEVVENYLTPHAERVFDQAGDAGEAQAAKDADLLARWVAGWTDDKGAGPTRQQAAQSAPRRFRDKARREGALALLTNEYWLRVVKREGGAVLVLNPALGREVSGMIPRLPRLVLPRAGAGGAATLATSDTSCRDGAEMPGFSGSHPRLPAGYLAGGAQSASRPVAARGHDRLPLESSPGADLTGEVAEVAEVAGCPAPTAPRCYLCGADPSAGEVGGYGAAGWRCGACLERRAQAAGDDVALLEQRQRLLKAIGQRVVELELPRRGAPLGRCQGCRFTAPLSARSLCGACEGERLMAAAERALAGVVATSDDGELLGDGDEP